MCPLPASSHAAASTVPASPTLPPLRRLGITRINRFISMSNMKYDAVTESGIVIDERVDIPEELIPCDAHVEIDAKVFAGYFAGSKKQKTYDELKTTVGRDLE
mmetsp:Transcript_18589/g.58811  ORF Transcript_18589/g.58811 Transcript_18589/m.58811 type:complete len:103 (+) Transcript_18589:945-1253(+)